jgi:light-regulated signal transduction histidine kinase (bacteriophytochrome)
LLIAAALVTAWYGGVVPEAASLLLGLVLGDYLFVHGNLLRWSDPKELAHFLRYLFTASLGIILLEVMHRANRRTHAALEATQRENSLRRQSEEALLQTKNQLSLITAELEKRVAQRTSELTAYIESLRGVQYHMVHHMRAPLRSVSCYTALLVEEYGGELDSTALSYCAHVSEAAARMDRLIFDLMEYAQLGHQPLSCAQINFAQPLHRAIDKLAGEMRRRDARIELTGPWPTVHADPAVLEKVLFNLLQNAIRFVAQGVAPLARVWPERRGSRLRVWIEDNGIGIQPEFHELIFSPFETLHPRHVFGGNGMGLAVVKEGIYQMDGEVGLEAPSTGGTRFWIADCRFSTHGKKQRRGSTGARHWVH